MQALSAGSLQVDGTLRGEGFPSPLGVLPLGGLQLWVVAPRGEQLWGGGVPGGAQREPELPVGALLCPWRTQAEGMEGPDALERARPAHQGCREGSFGAGEAKPQLGSGRGGWASCRLQAQ